MVPLYRHSTLEMTTVLGPMLGTHLWSNKRGTFEYQHSIEPARHNIKNINLSTNESSWMN